MALLQPLFILTTLDVSAEHSDLQSLGNYSSELFPIRSCTSIFKPHCELMSIFIRIWIRRLGWQREALNPIDFISLAAVGVIRNLIQMH